MSCTTRPKAQLGCKWSIPLQQLTSRFGLALMLAFSAFSCALADARQTHFNVGLIIVPYRLSPEFRAKNRFISVADMPLAKPQTSHKHHRHLPK